MEAYFRDKGQYTCDVYKNCSILKTPHQPYAATYEILPPSWPWMSNLKRYEKDQKYHEIISLKKVF